MGCILGEMISCCTDYHDKKLYAPHKRIQFKGNSCHPLSPIVSSSKKERDQGTLIDEDDQILKICEKVIAKKTKDEDFSFLSSQS